MQKITSTLQLLLLISVAILFSCIDDDEKDDVNPDPKIKTFVFESQLNNLNQTIKGVID